MYSISCSTFLVRVNIVQLVAGTLKEERLSPVQRCYILEKSMDADKDDLAPAEKCFS